MTLHSIEAGNFKLDGGAMFGVVPKSLWNRTNPADSNNMIDMAARCLLIEDGKRLTLIDTGMGTKQDEKFFGFYYMDHKFDLLSSIKKAGFHPDEVTDVFFSHLHFDHCGGAIFRESEKLIPQFKNAQFYTHSDHWEWATKPNAREKASFLKENILPIEESGQLIFADKQRNTPFDFITVDGHTEKMMLPKINYKGRTLVYVADLLPTVGHLPLPYVMGYDTRPLLTLDEKARFLNQAADENWYLFLEHDPYNEVITVQHTEKGVRLKDRVSLEEFAK